MDQQALSPTIARKVAFVGNHLPRKCGIATFTTDLSRAVGELLPGMEALVVAMNDAGQSPTPTRSGCASRSPKTSFQPIGARPST